MGMMVLASAASLRRDSSLSPSLAEQQHGVVPLLAAAPPPACLVADSGDGVRGKTFGGGHLWHPPRPSPDRNPNLLFPDPNPNPSPNFTHAAYLAKPVPTGVNACGILANYGTEASAEEGGGPSCRHCGNGRGYECSTHVKNTWVPAAARREPLFAASSQKKPRLAASLPENAAPSWSSDTTASVTHKDAVVRSGLPRQVRAPAMFRCVRVTPVDSGEMEYAYHATVKIGGRVFKGILYSNGVDGGKAAVRDMPDLHLGNQNGGGASSSGLFGGTNCGN
ncbi:protein SHI RELATED SEQUENCE 6-like [Zingiber officinale]|uniref:Uncharacterized protein n=1 Tax=Zingiber officinale TaxID=94328 RepID=A0A8J5FY85_ZINOF|nr:protein SHI RELATED SEQUENCE 6-like [Zingiber officinale]KAG6498065.1 hypothetical protein ZIOFF_045973 [Zingiber officinale]